jgi:esterase/lipase superfamily enzyme
VLRLIVPKYWLISDRDKGSVGTAPNNKGATYWTSDSDTVTNIRNWQQRTPKQFQTDLVAAADQFPALPPAEQENQSHVCILVHGFNVSFDHAASFYQAFCDSLFSGKDSLGLCILYDWPSFGNILGYEPDRERARQCADDLADVLAKLFDYLVVKQAATIRADGDPDVACKAKVSMVTHSMGNYVLQKAMAAAWTRKNQPLLVSLINQLVMVAADVDNDLFDEGAPDNSDGNAIANLTYRVTSLFSGRDAVLGASAGLKHFGTRRLGRSGLANRPPLSTQLPATDNVWDIDCSGFFPDTLDGKDIHGAYFTTPKVLELMREVLRGFDRGVIKKDFDI